MASAWTSGAGWRWMRLGRHPRRSTTETSFPSSTISRASVGGVRVCCSLRSRMGWRCTSALAGGCAR
eukprot:2518468-Rhodomonas_salina.1